MWQETVQNGMPQVWMGEKTKGKAQNQLEEGDKEAGMIGGLFVRVATLCGCSHFINKASNVSPFQTHPSPMQGCFLDVVFALCLRAETQGFTADICTKGRFVRMDKHKGVLLRDPFGGEVFQVFAHFHN